MNKAEGMQYKDIIVVLVNSVVEINYVCVDFIGDSITKITSNKGRGQKARILYFEGIL